MVKPEQCSGFFFERLKFDFIKKFDIEMSCSNYIKKLKSRGIGLKIRWVLYKKMITCILKTI